MRGLLITATGITGAPVRRAIISPPGSSAPSRPGRLVPAALNAKTEEHFADHPQGVFHTQVPDVGNTSGKLAAQAGAVRHRHVLTHAPSSGRAVRCALRPCPRESPSSR